MDARELRIGNAIWFDRKEKVKWVNSRVIADIESQNNECLYSPITLTEEWLVNFGFKVDGKNYYTGLLQVERDLTYFNVWVNASFTKTIKYVHQLQNMYFVLTGQELTIKETVL